MARLEYRGRHYNADFDIENGRVILKLTELTRTSNSKVGFIASVEQLIYLKGEIVKDGDRIPMVSFAEEVAEKAMETGSREDHLS